MGLARDLERRLESLVDGLASRLFRGRVHPVELGTRLVREADLAVYDTPAGPTAPNMFVVVLGGAEEPVESVEAAADELRAVVAQAAAERGWRLEGPVQIEIGFGGGAASNVSISAHVNPGEIDPWAHLETPTGPVPVTFNRSIVGRSSSADVHLDSDDVSRTHALLWREAGGTWLVDLGSSNGTSVNGAPVVEVIDLLDGDRVTFGAFATTFRVV